MNPADINANLAGLSEIVYITQEVVWGADGAVDPSEYEENGKVSLSSRLRTVMLTPD